VECNLIHFYTIVNTFGQCLSDLFVSLQYSLQNVPRLALHLAVHSKEPRSCRVYHIEPSCFNLKCSAFIPLCYNVEKAMSLPRWLVAGLLLWRPGFSPRPDQTMWYCGGQSGITKGCSVPCQYSSISAPYSFVNLSQMLYNAGIDSAITWHTKHGDVFSEELWVAYITMKNFSTWVAIRRLSKSVQFCGITKYSWCWAQSTWHYIQ
jgi:hypothetical protein